MTSIPFFCWGGEDRGTNLTHWRQDSYFATLKGLYQYVQSNGLGPTSWENLADRAEDSTDAPEGHSKENTSAEYTRQHWIKAYNHLYKGANDKNVDSLFRYDKMIIFLRKALTSRFYREHILWREMDQSPEKDLMRTLQQVEYALLTQIDRQEIDLNLTEDMALAGNYKSLTTEELLASGIPSRRANALENALLELPAIHHGIENVGSAYKVDTLPPRYQSYVRSRDDASYDPILHNNLCSQKMVMTFKDDQRFYQNIGELYKVFSLLCREILIIGKHRVHQTLNFLCNSSFHFRSIFAPCCRKVITRFFCGIKELFYVLL